MTRLEKTFLSVLGCVLATTIGCASLPAQMPSMPSMPSFASKVEPGTAEWWKKNQKKATYVQGMGYQVEGVPGYFDKRGQPMDAPMAEEALVHNEDDMAPEGLLPGLDPKLQYEKAKTAVGLGPNQQKARDAYTEADKLYAEGKYSRAAKKYKEAAERWPNSTVEQQAMYQEANCYFYDDRYIDARDKYVELMEKHPNSGQVDNIIERMWAMGQYWENYETKHPDTPMTPNGIDKTRPWFDTLGHSIKTYENIQLYDPTGPRADDAIMAIAGIYFRTNRYNDADHYYELLRQQYPRSDFQFEAHLLGLQAKLRKYQGPEYDGKPLEEAKKLASQLGTQFGRRLSAEERERLQETQNQVARAIVDRDMTMASHYENTGHYGAAKMHLAEVIKKNPDTELAAEAREKLTAIAEEPNVPTEPAKWLIDMFPENPERTRVARVPELRDSRGDNDAPKEEGEGTILR
jgi:outer membrane protein assembly factor BamD (BamD/ComL family)